MAPSRAKGRANTVCSNLIMSNNSRKLLNKGFLELEKFFVRTRCELESRFSPLESMWLDSVDGSEVGGFGWSGEVSIDYMIQRFGTDVSPERHLFVPRTYPAVDGATEVNGVGGSPSPPVQWL